MRNLPRCCNALVFLIISCLKIHFYSQYFLLFSRLNMRFIVVYIVIRSSYGAFDACNPFFLLSLHVVGALSQTSPSAGRSVAT